jgi:thymidylate synthase
MNNLDKQYQTLLKTILEFGVDKQDRTGTGTKSIFGYTIRHNMKDGFPLLTTKKMPFKTIVTELLWFLRGDTNIKFLVDNDCHIWDGDAYKNYKSTTLENDMKKSAWELSVQSMSGEKFILSQEKFINKIKTDDKFAKKWGELGPIYGAQWRNWGEWSTLEEPKKVLKPGIDQIQNLIRDLKTTPDSRRLMVNAWNVGELDSMVLPPCHYGFQVYTRELTMQEKSDYAWNVQGWDVSTDLFELAFGKNSGFPQRAISLMWNQRSVDTFLGLPFNIASYGLLLEIIAKEVNMVPDELIGNLGDVHLYSNHIEQAKEQMTREPYPLPKLGKIPNHWVFQDNWESFNPSDFTLENYQSHPTIKAPLSN